MSRETETAKRRAAQGTGREDIEAAVAASKLMVGQRVTMTGEIALVSADSSGAVWTVVRVDGERRHCVSCWGSDLRVAP